ncbi:MAG: glycosyltransferase family 1 protein [Candidatus Doudnabacteria bacterium]
MHIGIESERANNPVKTGVEHYAHQLIKHLALLDHENNYTLYLRTKPEKWFFDLPKKFLVKVIPFPKFWTQIRISWEMLWHAPDLLFIPASALPLITPKRSVITIHDTAWLNYPEAFTWFMRHYLHWSTKTAVKKATKIIAVSQSTKTDLVKYYNVDPEKIAVIPHGYTVSEQDQESTSDPLIGLSSKTKALLPDKYILFLSTIQPRKNLPGLIAAFREFKNQFPEFPHKLVVVGKLGWKFEESLKAIQDNSDIVVYLGRVDDQERWPIFRKADLFINASLYEGFGMWILEAFECQVPVAVSKVSSLPEVGGDAAVYFDPQNSQEIIDAIVSVLRHPEVAEEMRRKGLERLKLYGWDRCAEQTLNLFNGLENEKDL